MQVSPTRELDMFDKAQIFQVTAYSRQHHFVSNDFQMDHLPYPRHPAHKPLIVHAFLDPDCVVDCAGDDPIQEWKRCFTQNSGLSVQQLQRWLYFGVLSRVPGQPIRCSNFLRNGRLHSSCLPGLLSQYQAYIHDSGQVSRLLCQVELELRRIMTRCLESGSTTIRIQEGVRLIVFSIRVLTNSIWRAFRSRAEFSRPGHLRHDENYENPFAPAGLDNELLRRRMTWEKGWCRSLVSTCLKSLTTSTVYYLSALQRSVPGNSNHRQCTDDRCNLFYDESSYSQEHTQSCTNDCNMVEAPLDEISKILQSGGIPLVRAKNGSLKSTRARYQSKYVAMTHVWSGGLGNPKGNAIRQCQLSELTDITAMWKGELEKCGKGLGEGRIPPERIFPQIWQTLMNPLRLVPEAASSWFWIDTLNIPRVDDTAVTREVATDAWEKRTLAIDRMTQTYAAAEAVIVLDPELRQLDQSWDVSRPNSDHHLLQILSHILISSWMGRCWTYQEGAMGQELMVKLRSQLFPLRLARRQVLSSNQQRLVTGSYGDLADMLDEVSAWFSRLPATRDDDITVGRKEISNGAQGGPEMFTRIWTDVATRSTTRTVDRLSIFSLLLDLRPTDVRVNHPRGRLVSIFKAQHKLPFALLFQSFRTVEEAVEEEKEFEKEAAAERDRGNELVPYHPHPHFPLPNSIMGRALPEQMGWMQHKQGYLYFDAVSLSAGLRQPTIFRLDSPLNRGPGSHTSGYTFIERPLGYYFQVYFAPNPDVSSDLIRGSELYFISSCSVKIQESHRLTGSTFPGVLLARLREDPTILATEQASGHESHLFQVICAATCHGFGLLEWAELAHPDQHIQLKWQDIADHGWRIKCDFGNVKVPTAHRIRGFVPAKITAFNVHATVMLPFFLYYLSCLGFICIPVFAHTPGSFPPGWLAMIGFLFQVRLLSFTWNNTRDYRAEANNVLFNAWVNGIGGPDDPPIISHHQGQTRFSVHLSRADTMVLVTLSFIFAIAGAARYSEPDVRWMVATGISFLCEILLRWFLELCLPRTRFWGPEMQEHPALRDAYMSPSRFTEWLRNHL